MGIKKEVKKRVRLFKENAAENKKRSEALAARMAVKRKAERASEKKKGIRRLDPHGKLGSVITGKNVAQKVSMKTAAGVGVNADKRLARRMFAKGATKAGLRGMATGLAQYEAIKGRAEKTVKRGKTAVRVGKKVMKKFDKKESKSALLNTLFGGKRFRAVQK